MATGKLHWETIPKKDGTLLFINPTWSINVDRRGRQKGESPLEKRVAAGEDRGSKKGGH